MRLRRFIVKGGESGPAIVPGKPQDSELFKLVSEGENAEGKKHLAEKDIAHHQPLDRAGSQHRTPRAGEAWT